MKLIELNWDDGDVEETGIGRVLYVEVTGYVILEDKGKQFKVTFEGTIDEDNKKDSADVEFTPKIKNKSIKRKIEKRLAEEGADYLQEGS